jgi:hypothetical protein
MKTNTVVGALPSLRSIALPAALAVFTSLTSLHVRSECSAVELTSGLLRPASIIQTSHGNLLIGESGTFTPNSGRISIIDLNGHRRTLVDGMPSGIADVGDPAGPAGLFLRGRTLYVAISVGDIAVSGGAPGTALPNPNPPSSPLFSSILAIHFSASVEKFTEGMTLTPAHQQALAQGKKVTLSNGAWDKITIELIADFPNFIPAPLPTLPRNIQVSNPFDLVAVEDQLYVTDGGRNHLWQVDIPSGSTSVLAFFPDIPNPLFPAVGGPFSQAVPTGIRYADDRLFVALFRGVPFAPGTSTVEEIDLLTGAHAPFITGLKTAIDVLPISTGEETDYLVLQHASVGPFFGSPGLLLYFAASGGVPTVVADCLTKPTSMTLDEKTGTLYVTELAGRVVAIPLDP